MSSDQWFTAEVTNILESAENTKRFFFRVKELEVFNFKPGQFVTFDLPVHEKKSKRWKSYSMASPPNGTNEFELVIVHAPHGLGTDYFWNVVCVGSELKFKGPLGVFTLPEEIDKDICLIATGTGIAPYRSMLHDLLNHPRPTKNLYLIFGTRYQKDILYREEMEAMVSKIPDFNYIVTLSRQSSIEYSGRKGYVHPVYEELFTDKRPAHFYLCGWRNMIREAQQRILSMGYNQKNIHIELYG